MSASREDEEGGIREENSGKYQGISFNDALIQCIAEIKECYANSKLYLCDRYISAVGLVSLPEAERKYVRLEPINFNLSATFSERRSLGCWFFKVGCLEQILRRLAWAHISNPDANDDGTKHSYVVYTDEQVIYFFKNSRHLRRIKRIACEIIGDDFDNANNEDAILALKATTFAFKCELILCPQNCDELKNEYDLLQKKMTGYPKLQKLAASIEVFFGCLIETVASLYNLPKALITRSPYIENSLLSDGILRWRKSNLSQKIKKLGELHFPEKKERKNRG